MKKTMLRCAVLAALACGLSLPASAGELKLTMQDGRVTLIASDVPLRQILLEWARIGQAKIVNGDKLSGPNVTIQIVNQPERDVLDILLRNAAGYIAAPRPTVVANAALYDRVTIMPTSRAPAAVASAPTPTFQRPPQPVDDGDEPINVTMPPPPPNPVTSQFPGMMPQNQQTLPATATQPGPLTSPRPGGLPAPAMPPGVPNPYQPGQIMRPGQPPQPIRPGGGPGGGQ